jgi:predicted TIM-barrel fold metal-dependent hydrolase
MIVDAHHHIEGTAAYTRKLLRAMDKLGIDYLFAMGLPDCYQHSTNDQVERAIKDSKGRIVGFGFVDLGRDRPDKVDELRDRGFRGLKLICPKYPYDHGSLYPIYERAQALGMPGLFHLGVVAYRPGFEDRDISSARMRPIHLDPVARAFPKWVMIGAHLGNPWHKEAAMCARWHVNLFFDLSGSTLKKCTPEEIGHWLWWRKDTRYRDPKKRHAWEKIVFGSDVDAHEIHDVINDYRIVMETNRVPANVQEKVWGKTAAGWLKLK